MRLELLGVVLAIAGCSANRPLVGAHEACILKPKDWAVIEVPTIRAAILALRPSNDSQTTARQFLWSQPGEVEVWLRNTSGRLAACVYDPRRSGVCSGGNPRMVEFEPTTSGTAARVALEIVCVTSREPLNKLLHRSRAMRAPAERQPYRKVRSTNVPVRDPAPLDCLGARQR